MAVKVLAEVTLVNVYPLAIAVVKADPDSATPSTVIDATEYPLDGVKVNA